MSSTLVTASPTATSNSANPTSSSELDNELSSIHKELNPALSFVIGLAIILGASIMNAGGLNLVKLDMVRTQALPKAQQRRDFLRPLWLLGMILYILSQLVGSTLALEFLRAEYVAPLGSSSLIFNFIFARWLVGTPVTRNDIYGTITVIVGVIGIVAFGSINKGLITSMDLDHLITLWSRAGWLAFFVLFGVLPIFFIYIGASQLDSILMDRLEVVEEEPSTPKLGSGRGLRGVNKEKGWFATAKERWDAWMTWTKGWIERWSRDKSDKTLAWTLGILWACCGGALAGGCLVFAKASVKLISGSLSHRNTGNQFVHPAPIFTFIFLATTAILQIICLNRGLRVYDSTLVVPVFYGVYTASGFLDSLVFNDEVDAYETWTLFLIFSSILILICGVVLLTLKKPEPKKAANGGSTALGAGSSRPRSNRPKHPKTLNGAREDDEISLTEQGMNKSQSWEIGDDDDDDDEDLGKGAPPLEAESSRRRTEDGYVESRRLIRRSEDGNGDEDEGFGDFQEGSRTAPR